MSIRKNGNPNIPFKRDANGKIIYGKKHREYIKAILDPNIRFVEAEGSVRAGKDVYGLAGYALLLDLHENTFHLALATTIAQASLLILDADGFGIMHHFPNGYIGEVEKKTAFIFKDSKGREKYLILAGGQDVGGIKTIQGLNYGTVYANETTLLHLDVLNTAKDRIMASTMPKFICTQNPGIPTCDYYEKFEKPLTCPGDMKYYNDNPNNVWNGPLFIYFHFTQYDNPALSLKRIKENESTYGSNVDKQRMFYGLRVAAEGAIYDMLTDENYYEDGDGTLSAYDKYTFDRIILIDVGTTNPQVYIDCFVNPETFDMYLDREYRWDSLVEGFQKTDSVYTDDLIEFIRAQVEGQYDYNIIDPAAASMRVEMETRRLVVIEADNTVMGKKADGTEDNKKIASQGIKLVGIGIAKNKIHINKSHCVEGIKELKSYRWDPAARERGVEQPLKQRDHFPDALRYGVNTHIKYSIRWGVSMEN